MKNCPFTFLFLFLSLCISNAQIITIGQTGDFPNLAAAASSVQAGDTLLVQAQVFSDGIQFLENLNGTPNAHIVILAEQEHQSIFRGGTEAIHLINCTFLEINGIVVEQQTGNGINIDDGGDYDTPAKHITVRNCIFRDMAASGNNDLLKMSGVDSFLIENCQFLNGGAGGSGIDFVGCHWGTIQDCYFDNPGTSGIQNKGGTQYIRIQRNVFKNVAQRALNLGGSTGLQFFRPPLPNPIVNAFEAADLDVFSNIFIGSRAPIAYVGSVRVKVYNNTFYQPDNWVIRILQETTEPGFLPCSDNEFRNNIVYLPSDLTEVNIGPNTEPGSFIFSNNLWFNASENNWTPTLPVMDQNQIIADPMFENPDNENFNILPGSPAIGAGIFLPEPSHDFLQFPYKNPPSIGAFEGDKTVSLKENENQQIPFLVFPNPASQILHVQSNLSDGFFQLLNLDGKVLKTFDEASPFFQMDISQFSSGTYFIILKNKKGEKIASQSFLKN
ncbi:MAG: right-handed parallel beta-helix repeat-containing protein [Saprospiraceae bacterium]